MEAFRITDRQIGGGHMYGAVISYLANSIGPRLFTGRGVSFTAAASLTQMAGWMAHDSGRDQTAKDHLARAAELAVLSRAGELEADVAAAQAHLDLHFGDAFSAVEAAQRGRQQLGRAPRHPTLLARLHAVEARGVAAQGDRREATRLLRRAEGALQSRDCEASPWVAPFDEGSLASEEADALHQMGDFRAARRAAERVLDLRRADRPRSRAFGQLSLALILLRQPQPDPIAAAILAGQVIDQAATVASARIRRQLGEIRLILERHRTTREVAEFLEASRFELGI